MMHASLVPRILPLALALAVGCQRSTSPPSPPTAAAGTQTGTVTLEIKHGESAKSFQIEDVPTGTTLESLMRSIEEVTITGSGMTAFVGSIDGTSMNNSEAWTFQVDGEFANQGIGSTKLSPPTTITWTFGENSELTQN